MNPIRICSAFWTASSAVATDTTDLAPVVQNMVDTVGEEVKQTSGILNKIFQPILDKLPSLIFAILFLLIGFFLVKQIMRILKRAFNRSNMDGIMSSFIRSVAKIVLYVLLIVIALSILDVPMDSIVAVIASAGVAVGLALKDSLSNLAGGFIILFSKPLKEGDTIEADGVTGKVEAITILYTRIVTADNKTVFIPNGVVASGKIIMIFFSFITSSKDVASSSMDFLTSSEFTPRLSQNALKNLLKKFPFGSPVPPLFLIRIFAF